MAQQNMNWHDLKSVHNYNLAEVASAMQKEIRRSNPDGAMYWASELFRSGYDKYCWKRLQVIMTEDVDALSENNRGLMADIHALYETAMEARKTRKDGKHDEREGLSLMAAVMKLAMADKSRIACNAKVYHIDMPRVEMREIPDYALDRHTKRGKQMGRDWDYFFDTASRIRTPDSVEWINERDPYVEAVRDYLNNPRQFDDTIQSELKAGGLFDD